MSRSTYLFILLATSSAAIAADEWSDLFYGKVIDGWVHRGGKANYAFEEGCIVGSSTLAV